MDIQHTDDGLKGKFFITRNDKELAEMTYVWVGTEKIIIDHTEVDDALRGQGAGRQCLAARQRARPALPVEARVFVHGVYFRAQIARERLV